MKIENKQAHFDYTIKESVEAGVKLTGPGAFVKILGSEVYLINSQIQPYSFANIKGYDPRRTRKLLLSKKEIIGLKNRIDGGNFALIPLSMYIKHGIIKVEVGLGIGRKQYEKREILKKRAEIRDIERQFRGKIR